MFYQSKKIKGLIAGFSRLFVGELLTQPNCKPVATKQWEMGW